MTKMFDVPVSELVEDPKNVRQHSTKNLAAIRHSLQRFGQVEPLVVRKGSNIVIGGNGRLAVMRDLGFDTVKVVYVDVTDDEAAALAVALNRTAELADWDYGRLGETLEAFFDTDLLQASGWEPVDAASLIANVDILDAVSPLKDEPEGDEDDEDESGGYSVSVVSSTMEHEEAETFYMDMLEFLASKGRTADVTIARK